MEFLPDRGPSGGLKPAADRSGGFSTGTTSPLKKSLQAAERQRADVARARRRWMREQTGAGTSVEIYRLVDEPEAWSLEVINQEGASTVWDETFTSDGAAYGEFYRTLENEGIRSFVERPTGIAN